MANENIFLKDVKVPEKVKQKADIAFSTIKKDGDKHMKKKERKSERKFSIKSLTCAAAAALLVVAGVYASKSILPNDDAKVAQQADSTQKPDTAISKLDKMFTLQVHAAAMEPGKAVPVITGENNQGWVLSGSEDNRTVNYCFSSQFTCQGDNIESISYAINKGAFQVVEPMDSSIIIGGEKIEEGMNSGQIGGEDEENSDDITSNITYYKSITLAYEKQSDEHTWINVCGDKELSQEEFELTFGDVNDIEREAAQTAKLVDDIVITCTVHYTDGTTEDAEIVMGTTIMTSAEADRKTENPEEKICVLTYELK